MGKGTGMGKGLGVSIRHGTAVAVAAALLFSAGLAGCEDGSAEPPDSGLPSKSETTPTESAPTQPSETGPTPPELPDAAAGTGPKAAEAFVRHYVDLINYARMTFDVEPLRSASGRDCENCLVGIQNMLNLKKTGARIEGGRWTVLGTQRIPGQPDAAPVFDLVVRHPKERVIRPGQPAEVNDASKDSFTWWLRYTEESGWQLDRWDVVEVGI